MNKLEEIQKLQEEHKALGLKLEALVAAQAKEDVKPEITKPKIDWTKIPVDTFVAVQDGNGKILPLYFVKPVPDTPPFRRGYVYEVWALGRNSQTKGNGHAWRYNKIKLLQSEWKVWQGGECPLPEGVKVKVIYRNGEIATQDIDATIFNWSHTNEHDDIIAYQIQESDWYD